MGPLPIGRKQFKFLINAIDYFTKWVEAELAVTIIEAKITSIVWKNTVCRFGIPNIIISNNGRQLDNLKFQKFLPRPRHKKSLLFPQTPSGLWSNRSDE